MYRRQLSSSTHGRRRSVQRHEVRRLALTLTVGYSQVVSCASFWRPPNGPEHPCVLQRHREEQARLQAQLAELDAAHAARVADMEALASSSVRL